ncbi:hypothetical protein [Wolbachia endosymbiont (group B) of Gerris lacustris]|uniref:hypothetical protein n=1 Tax=Wolbachia endosymbiont (group B) of Gerris lacustris TaxID=3066159 RepID=UPI00333E730A
MSNENTEERESNSRIINDIEVKIKPKSFESNKEKNVSVGYVHKILDKLVKDLNDTFVSKLNTVLKDDQENIDLLFNDINRVENLIEDNRDDIKFLRENLNNLKEKVEELKTGTISDYNIDEWEAPTYSTDLL